MRDFRTVDAANMLRHFAQRGWGRRSLQHAKNLGVLDGVNPIQGRIIPRKAIAPAETHASTPDEVIAILDVLKRAKNLQERQKLQAQTAIALMFFGGLRPGEARGATWENYDGKTLSIKQSVWRKHTTDPKTASAAKPVPVIKPLREFLAELRADEGKPGSGPILRGVKGKPISLDMPARIVIRPALRNRANYRNGQSKHWKPLEWQGYYALRRGIATQLNTITRDPMAAKGLLWHSSINTTLTHYIKSVPEVTASGMAQVEQLFTAAVGQAVQ